jgi:lipid II:glycine glycyltransferase (peptidoglycan interpeptide bridge formation enzyme)
MNFGTLRHNLRKATGDILPTDTIFVDLREAEDRILERMKPKTRYNIRLAERRGVRVREGSILDLPVWMELYAETARRNGFTLHGEDYFTALFASDEIPVRLLIAETGGVPAAAMFLAVSERKATYLYGASSPARRGDMAPYALQWRAMRLARELGCEEYDLFGVAPRPEPNHPLYGLLRFKTGFGGSLFHRQGCWDYPLDKDRYESYRARELTEAGFHTA